MNGRDDVKTLTCDEVREMAGAFVLGALDPAEAAAVRAHLATCDDAHEEIAELGGVLPALAESVPVVEPPEGLKARIMAAAAADLEERTAGVATTACDRADDAAPEPTPFPSASERTARQPARPPGPGSCASPRSSRSSALAGWNLLLQNQLNATEAYQRSVAAVLDVAAQPGSLTAILTPADGTGSGLAAVGADGKVTLALATSRRPAGAPSTRPGRSVAMASRSRSATSRSAATGRAPSKPPHRRSRAGTVIALTREPTPGMTAPTGPVVSKGVATAPA